jgi:hypothetical protein
MFQPSQTFYATHGGKNDPALDDGQYVLDPYAGEALQQQPFSTFGAAGPAAPPRPPKRREVRIETLTLSDVEIDRSQIQLANELGTGQFGTVKQG